MALGDTHAGGGVGTGEWAQGAGGNWSGSGDWGAVSNPGNYGGTWGNGNLGGAMPNPWSFGNLDPGAGVGMANASGLYYGGGYAVDPLTGRSYNPAGGPNYSFDIFAPGVQGGGYENPAYNPGAMNTAGFGQGAVQNAGTGGLPAPAAPAAPTPAAPAAPPPIPAYMQPGNPAAYAQVPAWNLNLTDFSGGGGGGGPLAPTPWQAPAGLLGRV